MEALDSPFFVELMKGRADALSVSYAFHGAAAYSMVLHGSKASPSQGQDACKCQCLITAAYPSDPHPLSSFVS